MKNVISERPYPGLRPFKRAESDIFFGREEQTDQLLEKLSDTRFISVVGLSGCGKSSLVRAGMIAALESGYLASAGDHWRIAAMRPGENPIRHLAEALLADSALGPERSQIQGEEIQADVNALPFLLAALRRGPLSLIEVLGETPLPQGTNLLLLVDQFEELFRYHREGGRDATEAFVNLLLASAKQDEVPIYIVTTMRSEYVGDCALFHGLPEVINNGQFLVPRLTREQQEMAVVGPAGIFGGTIEPRLLNRLLNEMGNDPDQLPLLQHCLMRMWFQLGGVQNEVLHNEINITLEDYEAIGGLKSALSNHVDEAFEELDEKEQCIAEVMFRRLSERGAGLRDTRRPTPLSEIASVAGVSISEVKEVVEVFHRPDRSFITPSAEIALTSNTVLDMSHESLIRQWERLNKWVEEEAESARMYTHLEDVAGRWAQGKAALWRDPDLTLATQWKDKEKPTSAWANRYGKHFDLVMKFLDASAEEQKRRYQQEERERQREEEKRLQEERRELELKHIRQRMIMFAIVGVVLGIALLAVVNFWIKAREQAYIATQARFVAEEQTQLILHAQQMADEQRQDALKARDEAKRQARIARSAELAAQAQNVFETYPQRSLLLAVEALNVTLQKNEPRVPAAEEVLREALANTGGRGLSWQKGKIDDVVISPDGQWLVTASENEPPYLWRLNAGEPAAKPIVLQGPKSPETSESGARTIAISSDSHWLFTRSQSKIVWLWDLSISDPATTRKVLTEHDKDISAVAFSPDNRWLVTGSWDNTVRLWDLHDEDLSAASFVLRKHEASVSCIAISADNHWMVTNSGDGSALLWELNVNSSDVAPIIRHRYERISAVAISPDNRWLVMGYKDGTVRLWGLEDLNESPIDLPGNEDVIVDIVISPDNHWLVTSSYNGIVRLWDFDLMVREQVASDSLLPGNVIKSVAMSPDSHWLITGNGDGTIGLWDLTLSDPAANPIVLHGHEGSITHLDITSDSHWLVSSSEDGTVRLWDLTVSNQSVTPLVLRGHEVGISIAAVSDDSHWLATGSKDAAARLWDLTASNPSATSILLPGHEGDVYTIAISPDNHWLTTGSEDGTVRLWDLRGADIAETSTVLCEDDQNITTAIVSSDSRWLVVGSEDNIVRSWDLTAADPTTSSTVLLEQDEALYPMAISPNKCWLVAGSEDGSTRLWDLTSDSAATPVDLHKPDEYISAVSFSADSHWLVTASGNDTIRLWDLAKDKPEATPMILRGHEGNILTVGLSPDNHWLVTGSEDTTARLWDLTADDPATTSIVLRGHAGAINTVTISPDSHWLVTGSEDGTARLWMLQLDELIENACRTAGRNLSFAEWEKYFPGEKYRQTCSALPAHWPINQEEFDK